MRKPLTKEEFITKAKIVHHDLYEYKDVEYINIQTKITIICKIHGNFLQRPNNHLSGSGCPISYGELYKKSLDRRKALEKAGYAVIYIWESDWDSLKII